MAVDPRAHVYRHEPYFAAEQLIIERFVDAGDRVLDVGTGAVGRTARRLRDGGGVVTSIDISSGSTTEFARHEDRADIVVAVADLRAMPTIDDTFDVVFVGFHGMDYLVDQADRDAALTEAARALRPGGRLVLNCFNKLALWVSPRGLKTRSAAATRVRHFTSGDAFRSTLVDGNGLRLANRTLGALISEVEAATDLRWEMSVDLDGVERAAWITKATSIEPYSVFVRS